MCRSVCVCVCVSRVAASLPCLFFTFDVALSIFDIRPRNFVDKETHTRIYPYARLNVHTRRPVVHRGWTTTWTISSSDETDEKTRDVLWTDSAIVVMMSGREVIVGGSMVEYSAQ